MRNKWVTIASIVITLVALWALNWPTPGLEAKGRIPLVVFLWSVALWILRPIPEYLTAILGAAVMILLKVPGKEVLGGFADPVWWMVTFACILGAAIATTGLGRRIAYTIMDKLGTSPLRLLYGTTMTNNVLAPFTPSNTARGAILYGVTEGICDALGLKAGEKKGDHTLTLANLYINTTNTNMFLTAMGGNALFVALLEKMTGHRVMWSDWFIAAFVPMLPVVLLLPYIVYRLFPPRESEWVRGREFVREQVSRLGPPSRAEKATLVIMLVTLALWATELVHKVPSTTVSFFMAIMLLFPGIGAVSWKDVEKHMPWPMLLWLGFAMGMAGVVNSTGGFKWLVGRFFASSPWVQSLAFAPFMLVVILAIIFIHPLFSGMNAMGMIVIPVVVQLATARGFDPFVAGFLATLAVTTAAFFLPFNSAPNLIFYGSGRFEVSDLLKGAIPLALLIAAALVGALYLWWPLIGLL